MIKKLLPLLLFIVLSTGQVFSSGFQINEHGAKAMAMAGAFTGLANDASAVYFNPAGITQLNGTFISAGVSLIAPTSKFTGIAGAPTVPGLIPAEAEYEMESQIFTPFNFYITHQISDDFFVGLGVNNPYGLGTKWEDKWIGRYLAVDTELRTFFFNPVFAGKLSNEWSLAVGFIYALGDVKIIRNVFLANPFTGALLEDAQTTLEGDGNGMGWTAAIFYNSPDGSTSFGITARSKVKFEFEGTATTIPATLDLTPAPIFTLPTGAIEANLSTPMSITAGFAVKGKELTVTGDFQWTQWSSYDSLKVTFLDGEPNNPLNQTPTTPQASPREYQNSYILRLGFQYMMSSSFALRGGVLYDFNPVSDELVEPTLPDADRFGLNIGFGYNISDNFSIDLAYLLLFFQERTISNSQVESGYGQALGAPLNFNGTYKSLSHLLGINFSYGL